MASLPWRSKGRYEIPYVVSLHIDPDVDLRGREASPKQKLAAHAQKAMESAVLRNADLVLPVYEPIVDTSIHYPTPIHLQPGATGRFRQAGPLTRAEESSALYPQSPHVSEHE